MTVLGGRPGGISQGSARFTADRTMAALARHAAVVTDAEGAAILLEEKNGRLRLVSAYSLDRSFILGLLGGTDGGAAVAGGQPAVGRHGSRWWASVPVWPGRPSAVIATSSVELPADAVSRLVSLAEVVAASAAPREAPAQTAEIGQERIHHHAPFRERLTGAFERLEALPVLAESRDRLLEALGTRRSVEQAIATVESDVALAITVLRLARAIDPKTTNLTVRSAVRTLTIDGIEAVARRVSTFDFFEKAPGWPAPPERFRLHALATQRAADRLAVVLECDRRDELRVAALLHDVGKLVLTEAYPGYPERIHGSARTPDEQVLSERRQLGLDHAVAGGVLIRRWRFGPFIADAISGHHDPKATREARIIRLADLLTHYAHGDPVRPTELRHAAALLDIETRALRDLMYDLARGGNEQGTPSTEPSPLTRHETQILRLLADGLTYNQIADRTGRSPSTVRSHLTNIYRKLEVADRAQSVLLATRQGWL